MTGPSGNSKNSNNSSIDSTTPPAAPFKKLKISKTPTAISSSSSITITTSTTNMNTRPKKDSQNEKDEFEIVKVYLLNCPLVGSDSPAIKAAIEGIEKEEKRRIRDEKLRSKFGGTKSKSPRIDSHNDDDGDELVVIEKEDVDTSGHPVIVDALGSGSSNSNSSNHENDDMEWQDVKQQQNEEDAMVPSVRNIDESFMVGATEVEGRALEDNDSPCFLGQSLATGVTEAIARRTASPVMASTPLVAIIIALHTALRSDELGFACTGIADEPNKGKSSLGFAPPIREMHKDHFLPKNYDKVSNGKPQKWPSPLRYRKYDTGAMVLRVEGHPSSDDDPEQLTECRVTFAPANTKDDPTQHPCLQFPISEHINTDSWKVARAKTAPSHHIPPSLHYKNLPGLLSKFCRTFDLGAVHNDSVEDTTSTNNKSTSSYQAAGTGIRIGRSETEFPPGVGGAMSSKSLSRSAMELRVPGYEVPSTVGEAFPAAATAARDPLRMMPTRDRPRLGDFSGDLLPSGMVHPGQQQPPGMGNLMGPNHPMFARGGGPGVGDMGGLPLGGPGTMQPRFDPIVPPCLGGDTGRPSNPGENRRRRMQGEPNPDHLRPPNSFGSHSMFM